MLFRDHPSFRPGSGVPITRKNIAIANAILTERGKPLLTDAVTICEAFIGRTAKERHTTRASNCLRPKGKPVTAG